MQDPTTFRSKLTINAGSLPITLDNILKIVSEDDILAYYFHIYKLPTLINSPLREDKNPSFSIYKTNNNGIRCFDFGLKRSYGLYDLLMEYFHLDFRALLDKIWRDMCRMQTSFDTINRPITRQTSQDIKFEVCTRPFRDYDLEFWKSFGITQQWLRFGRVFAISDIIKKCDDQQINLRADKYAYVYVEFKDDIQSLKIYQPFNKRYKWLSDGNSSIWSLWSQLPDYGDKLIITSSVKDALCLWANIHVPSCSMQSEITIPKPQIVEQLKRRFKHIYILFDNDFDKLSNTGQIRAIQLANKYGFTNVCIDSEWKVKDPSDFYKTHGRTTFFNYFYGKIRTNNSH